MPSNVVEVSLTFSRETSTGFAPLAMSSTIKLYVDGTL